MTKAPVRMTEMAIHISESQMSAVVRVIGAGKGHSSLCD
jgi:hypothetical protein